MPVGGYIADFVCPRAKLVIELDGGQHAEQARYDAVRTLRFEAAGYCVLRYRNDDVPLRAESVMGDVYLHLIARKGENKGTPPSLREREGANSNSGAEGDDE